MFINFQEGFGVFSMAAPNPIAIFEYELAAREFIEFNHLENCARVEEGKFAFVKSEN